MPRSLRALRGVTLAGAGIALSAAMLLAQQQPPAGPPQPPAGGQQPPGGRRGGGAGGRGGRGADFAARDRTVPTGTATIAGRVVAADSGRPLKRARVIVAGGGMPHAATTDEQGRYAVPALPAGTYTISATKTGFVDGAYGQRRALGAGTPIEITDGQQVADADLKLSRGGVITGRVFDEDGEPLSRTMVTVMRQQYVRGEKQLAAVGADQTDDRGQFRVFGLPPGDYYVSASAGGLQRIPDQFVGPGRGGIEQPPEPTGYAATYYPGVIAAADASPVKLAATQELAGIDFQLQIVPLATVKGIVAGGAGMVMLVPADGPAGGGRGGGRGGGLAGLAGGQNLRTATKADGTFAIPNVTPGRYTIIARADGGPASGTRTAMQSITVLGSEITVSLSPAPGVRVSGTITLESSATGVPKSFTGFRVVPQSLDSSAALPRAARPADVTDKGLFSIDDVMAGHYVLRGVGARGWTMKATYLNGQDVTDQPLEVGAENVSGLNVIFTDRLSGLGGTVRDARGTAVSGVTVIAFPQDPALWRPQSRQIVTARTDKAGAYKMATVPAGDYLVVAVEDVEQGEWFDPAFLDQVKDGATKLSIGEGDQKTLDLKLSAPPAPPLPSASSTR